jgi:hypothetical protein
MEVFLPVKKITGEVDYEYLREMITTKPIKDHPRLALIEGWDWHEFKITPATPIAN